MHQTKALTKMHQTKAPYPDGMSPLFFQKYRSVVGTSVIDVVLNSPNLYHTFITLIPKKKTHIFVSDFYTISLFNVLYKLISKGIANRLKSILPKIIFDTRSAFVLGHQIMKNVLVNYELVHFLKRKTKYKKKYMSLK